MHEDVAYVAKSLTLAMAAVFHYTRQSVLFDLFEFSSMLKPDLQSVVESLCEDGCTAVNQYIDAIQSGRYPDLMRELNHEDCDAVLAELKSIMSVYDRDKH